MQIKKKFREAQIERKKIFEEKDRECENGQ